jgi:DHA2 family multidrug resistance protein-like MFS transporter
VREWTALAVLLLPVLLVAVDATVLSFALPSISEALQPSGTQLLWMIDIYSLVLAGLLVSMGSLADRVGRRRLLLIGSVGFAVVSVIAAYAPTAGALIASRAALGFFGAMLMPSTLSLLRNIFVDRQQRRLAVAIWAAGFSGGAALGPIVGGFLLEHYWWGSAFLMAVPVLVLLLVLAPIFVPESKDPTPGPVDVVSIGLSLLTMTPIVYAITRVSPSSRCSCSSSALSPALPSSAAS